MGTVASLHPVGPDLIGRIWAAADTGADPDLVDNLAWGQARHLFINRWVSGLIDLGGPRLRDAGIRPGLHLWGRPWLILTEDVQEGLDAYRTTSDPQQVDDVVADQLAAVGIDLHDVIPDQTDIGTPAHHRDRVASTLAKVAETVAAVRAGQQELDSPDGPLGAGPALLAAATEVLRLAAGLEPGWMTGPAVLTRRLSSLGIDPDRLMSPAVPLIPDGIPAGGLTWVAADRVNELASGLAHLSIRFASTAAGSGLVMEAVAEARRSGHGLVEAHGIHTRRTTSG